MKLLWSVPSEANAHLCASDILDRSAEIWDTFKTKINDTQVILVVAFNEKIIFAHKIFRRYEWTQERERVCMKNHCHATFKQIVESWTHLKCLWPQKKNKLISNHQFNLSVSIFSHKRYSLHCRMIHFKTNCCECSKRITRLNSNLLCVLCDFTFCSQFVSCTA